MEKTHTKPVVRKNVQKKRGEDRQFCIYCKKNVKNTARKSHRQNHSDATLCRSFGICFLEFNNEVLKYWVDVLPETTNSGELLKFIQSLWTEKESGSWSKYESMLPSITQNICKIYQVKNQLVIAETFKLNGFVGIEMLIGEFIYYKLTISGTSVHFFAQQHRKMANILSELNTTMKDIRDNNNHFATDTSSQPGRIITFRAINDIYNVLETFTDTVLLHCLLVYEIDNLSKYDNQTFEEFNEATGSVVIKKGLEKRIHDLELILKSFDEKLLCKFVFDPNFIFDDDVNVEIPSDLFQSTRIIRANVLEEMTLYIINRMIGTFNSISMSTKFKYGNILTELY